MSNPILALIPSGYKGQTATAPKVYSVLPSDGSGDFTFDRANGLATRINKNGLVEEVANDTPRLDYLNGTCPSLLLEDERTNNIRYSEDTTAADWTDPSNEWSSVSNTETSPSGELTADTIDLTASDNASLIRVTNMSLAAGVYAVSFWIKDLEGGLTSGTVDLGDEGIGDTTPSISTVSNQWVRVERIITITSTKTFVDIQLNFTGASNKVSIWGLQVELGSIKSSYIPTNSSTVTRFKDICKEGGDSTLFDITEGSFFIDVLPYNSGLFYNISLSDGNSTNRITWQFQSNGIQVRLFSSGSVSNYQPITFNQRNKILVTFKLNEYKIYINGALVHTESGTVPTGLDRVNFAVYAGTNNFFQGEVNDTRVYDTVLTQAEAIKLTT